MAIPTPRASVHPRRILMRSSLRQARDQDSEIKTSQLPWGSTDPAEAFALAKAFAISNPTNVASAHDWGHANASLRLWATEGRNKAFAFNEEKLPVAATVRAAAFDVSRSFSVSSVKERIFKVLIAVTTRITRWWQGSLPGIISFLDEAAAARDY